MFDFKYLQRTLALFTSLALPALSQAAASYTLTSPSGAISASIGKNIDYSISLDRRQLLSGVASLTIDDSKKIDRITKGVQRSADRLIASPFYRADSIR